MSTTTVSNIRETNCVYLRYWTSSNIEGFKCYTCGCPAGIEHFIFNIHYSFYYKEGAGGLDAVLDTGGEGMMKRQRG